MKNTLMEEHVEQSIFPDRRVEYAAFWSRFAAAFIDGLIVTIPLAVLNITIFRGETIFQNVVQIIAYWLYDALQESSQNMATVGKRAVRIKVTTVRGERISFGQATGRHFGKYISFIILLIGYFMMLWDDRRQTLHDKMAGTLVVSSD